MTEVRIETAGGAIYAPTWDAVASLSAKIAAVMAELEPLEKDGVNKHFKYAFLSYEQLAAAIRKLIPAHGLSFTWGVDNVEHGNATYLSLEVTFIDNETGAVRMVRWVGEGQDGQDKGTAKALTACVKYGLMRTFLTTDQDDVDSDRDGPMAQPKPRAHWSQDPRLVETLFEVAEAKLGLSEEQVLNLTPREKWIEYPKGAELFADLEKKAKKPDLRTPEQVKDWMVGMAATYDDAGTDAGDRRGLTAGMLEGLFPNVSADSKKQCRYSLLKFFWGDEIDSISKCSDGQVLAMLDWAGTEGATGKTISDPSAMGEAARIIQVLDEAAGQQSLV